MDEQIRKGMSIVISDKEFSESLHTVVSFVDDYFKKEPAKGMPFALHVFTRHQFDKPLEQSVIMIPGFPPPIGSVLTRYDIMRLAGSKYYTEFIKNKPAGKKSYPLAIFINSEAWAAMQETEKDAKDFNEAKQQIKKEYQSLADHPDRQEVVISAGMTLDNRNNMAMSKVTRMKDDTMFISNPKFFEYKEDSKSGSDLLINFYRGFMISMKLDTEGRG